MGFIPLSYWGYGCNDFLPTSSLVFYYNANEQNSYDTTFTGSATNTSTGIINLANVGTNLGIVVNSSYNNTYYGIDTLAGLIDNNIPLNMYDTATSGTILLKGYFPPFGNAQNKYLLRNPDNTNEGIRAFGTVNVTTKGRFTFSRGVVDLDGAPTSSMYTNEGYGTIAIIKQSGLTGSMRVSNDNFSSSYGYTGVIGINDFDYIFEGLGYFQAAAYWSSILTQTELMSASRAFNCNGLPQGYPATTASALSATFEFNGGSTGTTAYYLTSGSTILTRRVIAPGEIFYDCVCNSGSRLITGGDASATQLKNTCIISSATTYPTIEYLLIGGGGGGGMGRRAVQGGGGGGGAGGYLSGSLTLNTGSSYSITIGSGGIGASTSSLAANGGDTIAFSLTAFGGGAGGTSWTGSLQPDGSNGGCGGGSAFSSSIFSTGSQGGNGAKSGAPSNSNGGGGGGANENAPVPGGSGGNGGSGKLWLDVQDTYYAGGGGGGNGSIFSTGGTGGVGGGGTGANENAFATAGTTNTGGGGGGGYYANTFGLNSYGANGGSGVVVIRYNGTPQLSSGTIVQAAGMTYHFFTSSFTLNT
jgi:hypothetical protein